jgi:hypothetical protein
LFLCFALNAAYFCPSTAQQTPKYSEIPFTNVTHRSKLCSINEKVISGEVELSKALQGLELAVGITDYSPEYMREYIKFNAEGGLDAETPGLFPTLLDELASRAGFTWRNSYGRVLPPYHPINEGRQINGVPISWDDVLIDAADRYDFVFAQWMQTLTRMQKGVGFATTGCFDASTILIQGEFLLSLHAVFNPVMHSPSFQKHSSHPPATVTTSTTTTTTPLSVSLQKAGLLCHKLLEAILICRVGDDSRRDFLLGRNLLVDGCCVIGTQEKVQHHGCFLPSHGIHTKSD